MNVELLRKVQGAILASPERFDMGDFERPLPTCGTSHCIGGWACVLEGEIPYSRTAQRLLDLNEEEAERLFFPSATDAPKVQEFGGFDMTPQQAVDRIEHFIATDGRE